MADGLGDHALGFSIHPRVRRPLGIPVAGELPDEALSPALSQTIIGHQRPGVQPGGHQSEAAP